MGGSGRAAPNERRDEIEFAWSRLVPFPGRKVSEPEPLNFLQKKGSVQYFIIN